MLSFGANSETHTFKAADTAILAERQGSNAGEDGSVPLKAAQPLMTVGAGLVVLPRKKVEKILSNEYVDFMELPPAKGKSRPVPQSMEGQVIEAADLMATKKIIPKLAVWSQCFSLYAAVLAAHQPRGCQK